MSIVDIHAPAGDGYGVIYADPPWSYRQQGKKERQQLQQQLVEEENTQAPADQPDAATEQED